MALKWGAILWTHLNMLEEIDAGTLPDPQLDIHLTFGWNESAERIQN